MQHTKILDREAMIQIAILIVSGAFLLASFAGVRIAGFDPAWVAIVFCGLPILKEAAIGLITEFDIRADVLVSLALIAAVAIGEYFAAGEVALIMQIGGLLEELTVKRAQAGLERPVAMTPETARIVGPDGTETVIPAEEVKAGDTVRVIPGEKVPVDGEILDGNAIYYLAQTYRNLGENEKAIEYYQKVIDGYPNTERAANSSRYLEELQNAEQ